jgi:hypothetical protein
MSARSSILFGLALLAFVLGGCPNQRGADEPDPALQAAKERQARDIKAVTDNAGKAPSESERPLQLWTDPALAGMLQNLLADFKAE